MVVHNRVSEGLGPLVEQTFFYLQLFTCEEDDNGFYALMHRRRESFGEWALTLSVVVISIFF